MANAHQEAEQQQEEIKLEGKASSVNMIVGPKVSRGTSASIELHMEKMTHVHLENKQLELIENLNTCKNLSHIYLQENFIYTLVNDPFKGLDKIVQLNLYDNRINQMEGLLDLVNLKKLYLEKNCIPKLDGLDNCRKLEELILSDQELAPGTEFQFDEYSLAAISSSLRVLDLAHCQIKNPKPLYYLENIDYLNLKDNLIEDFDGEVCPLLQTMNCLRHLTLSQNPVCHISKYRDQVVLLSNSVCELDGRDIKD